jgi:2-polyprenyl-3-methyl-5-hydroxy-6-metoxy-1,4-benzoquinol methylase
MNRSDEKTLQRRVAGYHDLRLDGLTDIVLRAKGQKVLDLGCNRGLVGFEMANNGASIVHGCDIDEGCISVARGVFADLRAVESRFDVVDLTKEMPFPKERYDIVLMIATYHKIKRVMPAESLTALITNLAKRTDKFFVWRGNGEMPEAEEEMAALDRDLKGAGLKRVHTSYLSLTLGLAAIWAKY